MTEIPLELKEIIDPDRPGNRANQIFNVSGSVDSDQSASSSSPAVLEEPIALLRYCTDADIERNYARLARLPFDFSIDVKVLQVRFDGLNDNPIAIWQHVEDEVTLDGLCAEVKAQESQRFNSVVFFVQSSTVRGCQRRYVRPDVTATLRRSFGMSRALYATLSGDGRGLESESMRIPHEGNGLSMLSASSWMYTDDESCLHHWDLEVDIPRGACGLYSVYIDYPTKLLEHFEHVINENPTRAMAPLLPGLIFLSEDIDGFYNSMTDFVHRTNAAIPAAPLQNECQMQSLASHDQSAALELEELSELEIGVAGLRSRLLDHQAQINHVALCDRRIKNLNIPNAYRKLLLPSPGCEQFQSQHNRFLLDIDGIEMKVRKQRTIVMHRVNIEENRANQALAKQSKDLAEQSTRLAEQSRDLGEYTLLLAQQTSADSASMITIAAVTMFFLPATFVASLFSMGFFKFDDNGGLRTSHQLWIYPSVVIPLTVTVFAVWFVWLKFRPNKIQKQVRALNLRIERKNTALQDKP